MNSMRILGIDPGLARMGWAVADITGSKIRALGYGCFETPSSMKIELRLVSLYEQVESIVEKHKPTCIAAEQLIFATNKTTAFDVSQARGVVCLLAGQHHLPFYSVMPTEVKMTLVGYGRAEKQQVQMMVKTIYNLEEIPKPDDTADALAIAYTAGMLHKHII